MSPSTFRSTHIACRVMAVLANLGAVVLSGCMVGPDYRRPAVPELKGRFDQAQNLPLMESATAEPLGLHDQWWLQLNDPQLTVLVNHAITHNFSLREAFDRVCEARALRDSVALAPWPRLDSNALVRRRSSRGQTTSNGIQFGPSSGDPFTLHSAGVTATWELDVFGGLRRAIERENAEWKGTVEDLRDVAVTLIADVATNYVETRVLQMRLAIAEQNVDVQKRSLQLAENRYQAGLVGALDVKQAQTILKSTESSIPGLEEAIVVRLNRLAVLLGQTPDAKLADCLGRGNIPLPPDTVACRLPVSLIGQRPDVRAVERDVQAASAAIGVETANLYPRFSLAGDINYDSTRLDQLFNNQMFYSVGPTVRWNLITLGRTQRTIKAREAAFRQAVARFREALLVAVAEVEDGLVGIQKSGSRATLLKTSAAAAREAVSLSQSTYEIGETNFQRVLDAQDQLLRVQDSLITARGDVVLSFIRTYRAVGAGWRSLQVEGVCNASRQIDACDDVCLRFLPLDPVACPARDADGTKHGPVSFTAPTDLVTDLETLQQYEDDPLGMPLRIYQTGTRTVAAPEPIAEFDIIAEPLDVLKGSSASGDDSPAPPQFEVIDESPMAASETQEDVNPFAQFVAWEEKIRVTKNAETTPRAVELPPLEDDQAEPLLRGEYEVTPDAPPRKRETPAAGHQSDGTATGSIGLVFAKALEAVETLEPVAVPVGPKPDAEVDKREEPSAQAFDGIVEPTPSAEALKSVETAEAAAERPLPMPEIFPKR